MPLRDLEQFLDSFRLDTRSPQQLIQHSHAPYRNIVVAQELANPLKRARMRDVLDEPYCPRSTLPRRGFIFLVCDVSRESRGDTPQDTRSKLTAGVIVEDDVHSVTDGGFAQNLLQGKLSKVTASLLKAATGTANLPRQRFPVHLHVT